MISAKESDMLIEVRTAYRASNFPMLDKALENAVGRPSDFAGMGMDCRDHGWVCNNEIEAERISHAIKKLGLMVAVIRRY